MKVKAGYILRKLGPHYIIVGEGIEQMGSSKMLQINSSAAFVWESISAMDSFIVGDVAKLLCSNYGIDMAIAEEDAAEIVDTFCRYGLIDCN
ncbi:MAG: PqqD family protein [Bacteroidales bacterium]|nr:PqqD family protein [Bacteroidales bacterium]